MTLASGLGAVGIQGFLRREVDAMWAIQGLVRAIKKDAGLSGGVADTSFREVRHI